MAHDKRMASYSLNQRALARARRLIEAHQSGSGV